MKYQKSHPHTLIPLCKYRHRKWKKKEKTHFVLASGLAADAHTGSCQIDDIFLGLQSNGLFHEEFILFLHLFSVIFPLQGRHILKAFDILPNYFPKKFFLKKQFTVIIKVVGQCLFFLNPWQYWMLWFFSILSFWKKKLLLLF